MQRHESWRLEYRANRYMRDLPVQELLARAGHFLTNLAVHAPDGKLSIRPVDLDGDSCGSQRFTHALVKFGKRKYMAELLLAGRGRLSPATSYDDRSLGYARADNESCVSAYLDPADAHRFMAVSHEPMRSVGFDVHVPYLGSVPVEVRANTDFYVYCLAEAPDARLFDDFDGDACVVITKPQEFKTRIQNAISTQLPGWKFISGPVIYFDPFFCPLQDMVPHFFEHFQFSYQKENRLVWLPPRPGDDAAIKGLDHLWFDLGPLTNCARLLWV